MKTVIILLTNYYPFYKGEEYLENEIKIMSRNADYIYIFATMATASMQQTRDTPDNVFPINC